MASYLASLKQANLEQLVKSDHIEMVKGGGWMLPIAAVVIVMAVLFFLVGVGTWKRPRLKQAGLFALLGAVIGWASSYLTHTKTASAAGAGNAAAAPDAAQSLEIAYAALAPTAAAIAVMLLSGLAMLVVQDKKKGGKPGGPPGH
jgi:hypothetical protein